MVSRIMTYDLELPAPIPFRLALSPLEASPFRPAESRICPFRWSSCKRFARRFGIQRPLDRGVPIGRAVALPGARR
jgi:hypothetical protein